MNNEKTSYFKSIPGNVYIRVSNQVNELYSENTIINAPTNRMIFLDFEPGNSYLLEIVTTDWYLYSEF